MTEERLAEIGGYIAEECPNSIFAVKGAYSVEDCIHYFYHEKLCWCSCGDPDAAQKAVRDYLKLTQCKMLQFEELNDNPLLLCLAYTLDAAGLVEHGCTICGAWPTPEGSMFLELLEDKFNEEDN